MRFINVDSKKATLRNGMLTLETDIGYDITVPIYPMLRITEIFDKDAKLGFGMELALGELTANSLPQDKNLIKTQKQLTDYLENISHIPDSFEYDDFMIGFVYGEPTQPDNFKWMFQFRSSDRIFSTMIFDNGIDIQCPISTHSWFENQLFHGRMVVDKSEILKVVGNGAGRVRIIGKNFGRNKIGDTSKIPEGCDEISVRFHVVKNRWYLDYLKKGKKIGNPTELRGITADVVMKASTDRSGERPKVTERIKTDDIASLIVKAGWATILGR